MSVRGFVAVALHDAGQFKAGNRPATTAWKFRPATTEPIAPARIVSTNYSCI